MSFWNFVIPGSQIAKDVLSDPERPAQLQELEAARESPHAAHIYAMIERIVVAESQNLQSPHFSTAQSFLQCPRFVSVNHPRIGQLARGEEVGNVPEDCIAIENSARNAVRLFFKVIEGPPKSEVIGGYLFISAAPAQNILPYIVARQIGSFFEKHTIPGNQWRAIASFAATCFTTFCWGMGLPPTIVASEAAVWLTDQYAIYKLDQKAHDFAIRHCSREVLEAARSAFKKIQAQDWSYCSAWYTDRIERIDAVLSQIPR